MTWVSSHIKPLQCFNALCEHTKSNLPVTMVICRSSKFQFEQQHLRTPQAHACRAGKVGSTKSLAANWTVALQEQSAGGKPHHIRRSRRYWRLKRDSINAEFTEIISFWTISQMVPSDIFACIVCTHICRHSLSKHMQRNSTDGSMSFTEYYWSCWFIIWRSPQSPQTGVLCITAIWKFAHLTKNKLIQISSWELTYPPKKALLKMIFLFPRWDMLVPWRVHTNDSQWFGV